MGVNAQGRGPAWANSLFEDNAEFGLGYPAVARQAPRARRGAAEALAPELGAALRARSADAPQITRRKWTRNAQRVAALERALADRRSPAPGSLRTLAEHLVRKSVWIVGGDGWAYDIGYGGLDHVLAIGPQRQRPGAGHRGLLEHRRTGVEVDAARRGGQVRGRRQAEPQEGSRLDGDRYGNVYVAQIAMGASAQQTLDAFLEAEAYDGPSLIIAYSHCIAHGINMRFGMRQQKLAVDSGHWPLYRYRPAATSRQAPGVRPRFAGAVHSAEDYAYNEIRYKMLSYTKPDEARRLLELAQDDVHQRWRVYSSMAERWPAHARRGQGETGSHVAAPPPDIRLS